MNATDTPRRRRRDVTITAPMDMRPFAVVSGDRNPIHTDRTAALLAGLETPIVHGMWLSAAAQHVVTATDGKPGAPGKLIGWTARFLGMVSPGEEIDIRVDRVGIDLGAEVLEVTAKARGELVMSATARLAAPKTAYAFPGQGIQRKGMGLEAPLALRRGPRGLGPRRRAHPRRPRLLDPAVVRDNPTELWSPDGELHRHPDGVLYLTQFTQVAMATLAVAQVAEMREAGGVRRGRHHLRPLGRRVQRPRRGHRHPATRGAAGDRVPPRHGDAPPGARATPQGRTNYRLGRDPALADRSRPTPTSTAFVAEHRRAHGEFLQIVNFNLRGSQYAIAGTVARSRGARGRGRAAPRDRRRQAGRSSWCPGIDVPFHSDVLHVGVDDFRRALDDLLPERIDPTLLVGRYIPNLVPRLFTLDRDFVEEIARPTSGSAARRGPRRLGHLVRQRPGPARPRAC